MKGDPLGELAPQIQRILLTAYRSLDRAYAVSAEQEKGPIDSFRLELSTLRDDLTVCSDGADRRRKHVPIVGIGASAVAAGMVSGPSGMATTVAPCPAVRE